LYDNVYRLAHATYIWQNNSRIWNNRTGGQVQVESFDMARKILGMFLDSTPLVKWKPSPCCPKRQQSRAASTQKQISGMSQPEIWQVVMARLNSLASPARCIAFPNAYFNSLGLPLSAWFKPR